MISPVLRFLFVAALAVVMEGCDGGRKEQPQSVEAENVELRLLDEEGRRSIWEIEHRVNLLKEIGFATIAEALVSRDERAFSNVFSPGFEGSLPVRETGLKFEAEAFTVSEDHAEKEGPVLNGSPFARALLDRVRLLGEGSLKVHTHVITLAPVNRNDLAGGWKGTGKIEVFLNGGSGSLGELIFGFGFEVEELTKESLAREGWLASLHITRILQGKAKESLMRDATVERGIPLDMFWDNWKVPQENRLTNTGGVYLNDFNNDGFHDMFITDLKASFMFVGGPGGQFREATRALGIEGHLGGGFAAFVDLDGDGWEDLIHGIAQHPDGLRVYQNKEGARFEDVSARSNLPGFLLGLSIDEAREKMRKKEPAKVQEKATGISLADYDLDGKVDLYITRGAGGNFKSGSWIDGKSGKTANNHLLRNLGDWQFEDVTRGFPLNGGERSTSNAVWIHADEDLRPDLYVIDEFGDGILLINRSDGSFKGVLLNEKPTDFGSMGMTAGDVNNDGHTDIYIAEMYSKAGKRVISNIPSGTYSDEVTQKLKRLVDGSQLYLGSGGGDFQSAGKEMGVEAVGWAWGASLADLNNDGWLDLYATAGFISQDRGKPDG